MHNTCEQPLYSIPEPKTSLILNGKSNYKSFTCVMVGDRDCVGIGQTDKSNTSELAVNSSPKNACLPQILINTFITFIIKSDIII